MKTIYFSCNWGESKEDLLSRMSWMTPNNSGVWNNIRGITNIHQADYIVTMNGISNEVQQFLLNNPQMKEKVILFPREPPGIGTAQNNNYDKRFRYGFTYQTIYHVVTQAQHMRMTYDQFVTIPYHKKSKLLSSVTSMKQHTKGAKQRVKFLQEFCNKYPDTIDVYGGWWDNSLGKSYQGELAWFRSKHDTNDNTKYVGHKEYRYSLCFENSHIDNYFSEKFTDCLLSWTIPIYWGCTNIGKYFPKDCYYEIDIFDEKSMETVIEIINKPITEKNIEALRQARELILNRYNIWATADNLIKKE